jgi:hypothetical protein
MVRHVQKSAVAIALIVAAAAVLLVPAPAAAQILYGSITGTVTDPQKAAMPGVTVIATNTGTAVSIDVVTEANGAYTFRNLPPGTYDLKATLEGFKELRQAGLAVTAGQVIRADLTLQIGQLAETVNVIAESTLLQTEKSELNTELTGRAVVNLPLNQQRNYQTLLNLVPGATPTQYQNAELDTPARSLRTWVNGTQPNANTTRVDGAVSVNVWLPHHAMYIQSAESIDTVSVATNSFDADTGMAAGAAQTVITKSGTNTLKGSAFLFWNKDAFNTNTFLNEFNSLPKPKVDTKTFGATLGGPIVKNKLFYFVSWERFDTKRPTTYTYSVPTAKMRAGDFSEVAAAYPTFKLYNPFSDRTGAAREQWTNNIIPSQYMTAIGQNLLKFMPAVNSSKDINANLLLDDYTQLRTEFQKRDNIDVKLNWQITPRAMVWGKFGYMQNKGSGVNFYLGFDNPPSGKTKVYLTTFGTTWTIGPTTVFDANFGMSRQNQDLFPPDYGTNYGLEAGIPGTNNASDIRESGLPVMSATYTIGNGTANWLPLFRKETSYSGTVALTKVFPKHEMRAGLDFVRLELNHRQAEWGSYGLKGGFGFANNTTGATGYTSPGWNSWAAYLMGLANSYSEDTQTEDMSGRENQFAFYLRDRWNVTPKLTISAGARLDYYPLMQRANGRGIETLDYSSYVVTLGGIGGQAKSAGINYTAWYIEPRVGAAYRLDENTVFRAAYGQTRNPLPWSRPMRGSYPFDINNNDSAAGTYDWITTLNAGIPSVKLPDTSSGKVVLPRGVYIRSPNPNMVNRGRIQQWNVAVERRLPLDVSLEVAYVGTATDGGYADLNLNVGVPGGGGTAAKFYSVAGTTSINDWGGRTKNRYRGLQVALNRPFKNGLMLKGAYTWSQTKNMADEDGWTTLVWNYLPKFNDNFSIASFDRTHVASLGWVYELPFLKNRTDALGEILGGWQWNGIASWFTGTPYSIGGTNNAMACQGCGSILINYTGTPKVIGEAGKIPPTGTTDYSSYTYYDKTLFSQPSGLDLAGFGNTKRNFFRRPAQWNVDMSLFKTFTVGRFRPEFRLEVANVFNTRNWGAPNTTFTSPLFLTYSANSVDTTATLGYRRMQLGFRLGF